MKIQTISPMLEALNQPTSDYEPDFPGLTLARECRDAQTSVSNLRLLHDAGLRLTNLIAGPAGLLFIFKTGEEYLATGLHAGCLKSAKALAPLLADWTFGDEEELTATYASLPPDHRGPVPLR